MSLNKYYSGMHWGERKKLKDNYYYIVKSQIKKTFSKKNKYKVIYNFYFKNNPLDSSNCAVMAKMIEDILFEDDKYNIILSNTYTSSKAKDKKDMVNIIVEELK